MMRVNKMPSRGVLNSTGGRKLRRLQSVHRNSQNPLPLALQEVRLPLNAFPGENLLNVCADGCLVVEDIRGISAGRGVQLSEVMNMRWFEQNLDGFLQLLRLIFVGGQR